MTVYESVVVDGNQVPVAGAKGYVYIAGALTEGLTDDLGAPVSNPVTTDSVGYVKFTVPASSYVIKWWWLGKQRLIESVTQTAAVAEDVGPIVTPEQFGGNGFTTKAAAILFDNRAAFQAAIAALCALGGGTLALGKPHYAFAAEARTQATDDITTGVSGMPFRITAGHITFKSNTGRTDIWRRAQGLADPATWANWPLLSGGGAWRGGCIFLEGLTSAPADYWARPGVTLDGVFLQGGITRGSSYGNVNTSTGDGWDTSDKGIRADTRGSRYSGDIRIINGGVIGFRGELVYTDDDTDTTLFIRNGMFGETNGSCINPNSALLDVDGLYGYNFNLPFEGWGGARGRLVNATFENGVASGTLQGGKFGAGTFSTYYAPTRVTSTVVPYCHIDNLVFKNAGFKPGSWLDIGKVTLIDSRIDFENSAFKDGIIDTHISEVVVITDQVGTAGVGFGGGDGVTSANQSIQDIKIDRISFQRTKVARTAARLPTTPVTWYNSLGAGIVIGEVTGEMSQPPRYSAASSGNAVNFLALNMSSLTSYGVSSQNVQTTSALQSVANSWRGPFVGVSTTGSNVYPMTLPTTGFIEGSILLLRNDGPGQVYINGNTASGSGMRDRVGPVWLSLSENYARFRFDGNFWIHQGGGEYTATTTVANLPAASADWRGIRLTVTDANATHTAGIGAVVAGGGANVVPVTCDGTNWRIG